MKLGGALKSSVTQVPWLVCALGGPEVKRGSSGPLENGYGGEGEPMALFPTLPMPPLSPFQAALGDAPSPWEGGQALRPPGVIC